MPALAASKKDLSLLLESPTLFSEVDFHTLELDLKENETIEDSDGERLEKRGRKKGAPMAESTRKALQEALKGRNKYVRTPMHRMKLRQALKKHWKERKEKGLTRRPMQCSVCGEKGHNRQTCPSLSEEEKTKHRRPRTFEHRWKIGQSNRSVNAKKRKRKAKKQKEPELPPTVASESSSKRGYRCGFCGEDGHNQKTCPTRIASGKSSIVPLPKSKKSRSKASTSKLEKEQKEKEKPGGFPDTREVEDLSQLYTVPIEVKSMWKLALDCAKRAYRNGVNRQKMEFTVPLLRDGIVGDRRVPSNGDMVRQFRVAAFIVEAILKGIKTQSGLEGQIEVGVLDQQENTVYWEGPEISAILFPQPQTLDVMISQAMMKRKEAPRLQLIVNPQWQPGQIVSDFGFGQLKALRENFVNSFEDVFFMKQMSIFSDVVIVMRCFPSQWQIHLVEPNGNIGLIGTSPTPPDYETILATLRNTENSVSRLSWIDQLKTKYIERPKRLSPFPLTISKTEFEACLVEAGLSKENIEALNPSKASKIESEIELPESDIITGEFVRDIKLDPLKQFTSFFGQS